MTEISSEWEKQMWAKRIARYYITRGRNFSVEINEPLLYINLINDLLLIGIKKFYFRWSGITKIQFISSFEIFSYIKLLRQNYKDVEFIIIYSPPMLQKEGYIRQEFVETSIFCASEFIKKDNKIKLIYRRPHPFGGNVRLNLIYNIEKFIINNNIKYKCYLEYPCGCITITPNTNIYCCPFCNRKKRKKKFGNALRDKFVIGTINNGIIREINCDYCYLQSKNFKLNKRG